MTVSDLLNDRVDPKSIAGRIVAIGSTASCLKDEFLTPYSAGKAEDATMPGVMVHAQITSQILSSAGVLFSSGIYRRYATRSGARGSHRPLE